MAKYKDKTINLLMESSDMKAANDPLLCAIAKRKKSKDKLRQRRARERKEISEGVSIRKAYSPQWKRFKANVRNPETNRRFMFDEPLPAIKGKKILAKKFRAWLGDPSAKIEWTHTTVDHEKTTILVWNRV